MKILPLRTAVSPFLRFIALAVVGVALVVPPADAGQRKSSAKKTAVVSKRPTSVVKVSTRKVAVARKSRSAGAKKVAAVSNRRALPRTVVKATPSFGEMAGLHDLGDDPLNLKSSVAFVMDQDTHEVLLSKNDHAVLPIASLTKLMTGLIISQAHLAMDESITITSDDIDTEKNSRSRLAVGTTLTRQELLHLALMSSENRAAHALGRTYPGGMDVFVKQMNLKARLLGMSDTRYVEPTGLSSVNQSSARDLAVLANVAHSDPLLRNFTTSPGYEIAVGHRTLQYSNTNRLVKNPAWDIGLQKTGYISEAGRCLVMQAEISGRKLIMVFLDSSGKFSRLADAERVRSWVESRASLMPSLQAQAGIKG